MRRSFLAPLAIATAGCGRPDVAPEPPSRVGERFNHADGTDTTTWADGVRVARRRGRYVVGDVEHHGAWAFADGGDRPNSDRARAARGRGGPSVSAPRGPSVRRGTARRTLVAEPDPMRQQIAQNVVTFAALLAGGMLIGFGIGADRGGLALVGGGIALVLVGTRWLNSR